MTFFIDEPTFDPETVKPKQPPLGVSSFMEGLGAATTSAAIENDANFKTARTRAAVLGDKRTEAIERIGPEAVWDGLREQGLAPDVPFNPVAADLLQTNLNYRQAIEDMAREAAKADPEAWADLDLSGEAVDQEINTRLQSEYQDSQDILDMMPSGRGAAELAGGMAGITADIKNLPFMIIGGGAGSLMRVMGKEAMINAGAEAAFLPSQFDMAQRLGIEDPNVLEQIALAAGAGAVLGGAVEALGRGLRYAQSRNKQPVIPGFDPLQSQAMVDDAEDILASGRADALEQISRIPERTPKAAPFRDVNAINPDRPPLIPDEIAPADDELPDPAPGSIFSRPDTIDRPEIEPVPGDPAEVEEILRQAEEAATADGTESKPFVRRLRGSAKARERGQEDLRIDPDGEVGQQLKSMGLNSRSAPGLFKRGGRKRLDNLPVEDFEDLFPGIREAAGISDDGLYLDENGVMDVLLRDIQGDSTWLRSRADAARLEAEAADLERGAVADYVDMEPEQGGLFIDLNAYDFDTSEDVAMANIEADVTRWIDDNGFGSVLNDTEKREIVAQVQKNGGEVEYLVERALEREADFVDAPEPTNETSEEIPFGDAVRADGQGAGTAEPLGGEAAGGAAGQGGRAGNAGAQYERTSAGDQSVAPGIAPLSQRERLEAAQAARKRGGNAAADEGLFDMGARLQPDMFDDMTSPAAKVRMEAVSTDLRTSIEKDGDFAAGLPTPDGRTLTNASDALDYLDDLDEFSEIIALCGRKPTT